MISVTSIKVHFMLNCIFFLIRFFKMEIFFHTLLFFLFSKIKFIIKSCRSINNSFEKKTSIVPYDFYYSINHAEVDGEDDCELP